MAPELAADPVPSPAFELFKERIERDLLRHPVITDNAYTRWFSRGEASAAGVKDLLLQFSVFSNHFLVVQAKRMVNAASAEAERSALHIDERQAPRFRCHVIVSTLMRRARPMGALSIIRPGNVKRAFERLYGFGQATSASASSVMRSSALFSSAALSPRSAPGSTVIGWP